MSAAAPDLLDQSAGRLIAALRTGSITLSQVYDAVEAQIARRNPQLNALVTLALDSARHRIEQDPALIHRPLAGLPLVVKDLTDVAGLRTTYGSTLFAQHQPSHSDILVERLQAAGAVVIAKSNTSEFGAGANTFNSLFGATVNPHQPALTCGGSSGGSAVALATGMTWFATGSDNGGSLRIPAAFCGVLGMRPTMGSVAMGRQQPPMDNPLQDWNTEGPMARSLEDLALLLAAMAGSDRRDPRGHRPLAAVQPVRQRLCYLTDFGDILPVVPENQQAVARQVAAYRAAGWQVDPCPLDLTGVKEAFLALRALDYLVSMGPLQARFADALKPEIIWNIEQGRALSAQAIADALVRRGRLIRDLIALLADYDALLTPVTAVRPFPVEQRFVSEIAGRRLGSYVDWLAPTFLFSLWPGPALSVPVGPGADSLPDAVQLIGAIQQDWTLLEVARPICRPVVAF